MKAKEEEEKKTEKEKETETEATRGTRRGSETSPETRPEDPAKDTAVNGHGRRRPKRTPPRATRPACPGGRRGGARRGWRVRGGAGGGGDTAGASDPGPSSSFWRATGALRPSGSRSSGAAAGGRRRRFRLRRPIAAVWAARRATSGPHCRSSADGPASSSRAARPRTTTMGGEKDTVSEPQMTEEGDGGAGVVVVVVEQRGTAGVGRGRRMTTEEESFYDLDGASDDEPLKISAVSSGSRPRQPDILHPRSHFPRAPLRPQVPARTCFHRRGQAHDFRVLRQALRGLQAPPSSPRAPRIRRGDPGEFAVTRSDRPADAPRRASRRARGAARHARCPRLRRDKEAREAAGAAPKTLILRVLVRRRGAHEKGWRFRPTMVRLRGTRGRTTRCPRRAAAAAAPSAQGGARARRQRGLDKAVEAPRARQVRVSVPPAPISSRRGPSPSRRWAVQAQVLLRTRTRWTRPRSPRRKAPKRRRRRRTGPKERDHLRAIFNRRIQRPGDCRARRARAGRCHADASGYVGPWSEPRCSTTVTVLSMAEVALNEAAKFQYKDPSGQPMMLPSDIAFIEDKFRSTWTCTPRTRRSSSRTLRQRSRSWSLGTSGLTPLSA